MRLFCMLLLGPSATAFAQVVVGTAYGYGAGATGGANASTVTPTSNNELESYLLDDVARTILITKTFNFTGNISTGVGCDNSACRAASGGQLFLGNLSCGDSDKVFAGSISYDTAGTTPLIVGSNKSILGVNGTGILVGKGLQVRQGASNIIIQGIELTDINHGVVWAGDAIGLSGNNSNIWIDHCKFSRIGRMFVVSHYAGSNATLSNNEFDGTTDHSATCNGNHYWGLMFVGKKERITLVKNYFHDMSGRAPKLGGDDADSYFYAANNYFENLKGHAFDATEGVKALVEGNVFVSVDQPSTAQANTITTFVTNGGSACSAAFGRDCLTNSVDSASGKLGGGSSVDFVAQFANVEAASYMDAGAVAAYVKANAGPLHLKIAPYEPPTNTPSGSTNTTASSSTMPTISPTSQPYRAINAVPTISTTTMSTAVGLSKPISSDPNCYNRG